MSVSGGNCSSGQLGLLQALNISSATIVRLRIINPHTAFAGHINNDREQAEQDLRFL
jgi:hypothetical protein